MTDKPDIKLKRTRATEQEPEEEEKEVKIINGSIDKVIDLAFNPSEDKIREVTIIDRVQARLLPQLDMINLVWQYVLEISMYRLDSVYYEKKFKKIQPIAPNLLNEFMYRTAQWQKSVGGKNLERATDIALAETETRNDSGLGDDIEGTWKE